MASIIPGAQRVYRALVSVFVIVVLAGQSLTLLKTSILDAGHVWWYWPIIDYPMYAGGGREDESVDSEWALFAVLDDGATRRITKEDLGLNVFHFHYLALDIMRGKSAAFLPVLKSLPDRARIREVIVKSSGRVITRNGIVQREPQILGRSALAPDAESP